MRFWTSVAFLLAVLVAPRALAVPIRWSAVGNGAWNTAGNWSTGQVPTAADDVTVDTAVTITIANPANGAAGSLSISAAATIARANGRTLAVTNAITVSNPSGTANIQVPFTAASLTKGGAGTLALNGVALSGAGQEVTGAVNVTMAISLPVTASL